MSDEELAALDKEVKKLKRIASEWASQLHDLVEDRLPAAQASARLAAAQKSQTA